MSATQTAPALDIAAPRKRSRVPTVIQMEAVECGAACLTMVLGYHGRNVPLSILREQCQVSRDGTSALQVAKVARTYGLKATGARKELNTLGELKTPFIAFWGFNHFVVVEGWDAKGVFLNDPATGPRKVDWPTMDKNFTGIAIDIAPTEAFERGGRRPSALASLARHARGYFGPVIFSAILGVFLALSGVAAAGLLAFFINHVLDSISAGSLVVFFAAVAIALLAQIALGWIQRATLLRISASFSGDLAAQMLWRIMRLPMRFFNQRQPGEIAWRLYLPAQLSTALAGRLPAAAVGSISLVIYFIALLVVNWVAAVVGLVIALLNFIVLRAISRRQRDANQLVMQEEGKLASITSSGLSGIEYLKATGSESEIYTRFVAQNAQVVNARQAQSQSNELLSSIPSLLTMLATAAAIGIGAISVLNGTMQIGGLVALQMLMGGFLAPFALLVQLGSTWQQISATMPKIDDVLQQEPEISGIRTLDRAADLSLGEAKLIGRVEFRDVVFGYSRAAEPLLRGLSFTVHPGHRIALVGTSGAGKSTVSKLLTGLETPWEGQVLIDGVPREQIPTALLSASLALVDQSIVLFSGTVMENLTMWDPSIPRDQVIAAAKDACIHDVIAARPGGYESPVAEGADNYSGGQAQRLEIARALAVNPSILVMDEATSALDAVTEVQIDNAVRRRGCTTVVIAHRLSTIRDADLILVLDKGQVVQSGTHEELLELDGLYRNLVHS